MEKKLAITKVYKNDTKVLKAFEADQKDEAIAYGAELAKTNKEGAIVCSLATFDDEGKMNPACIRVYEVWGSYALKERAGKLVGMEVNC